MKTKAAVAWQASPPVTVKTVGLQGPKFGKVLIEIEATEICRTDRDTASRKKSSGGTVVDAIAWPTDGGADFSFARLGNTRFTREAPECTHNGLGLMTRGKPFFVVGLH